MILAREQSGELVDWKTLDTEVEDPGQDHVTDVGDPGQDHVTDAADLVRGHTIDEGVTGRRKSEVHADTEEVAVGVHVVGEIVMTPGVGSARPNAEDEKGGVVEGTTEIGQKVEEDDVHVLRDERNQTVQMQKTRLDITSWNSVPKESQSHAVKADLRPYHHRKEPFLL